MKSLTLTKPYIVEGVSIKENSPMFILEEGDNFDNFMMDKEGNHTTNEEIEKEIRPMLDKLLANGLLDGNNGVQIEKDILDFAKAQYARYSTIPSYEDVVQYIQTRNPTFSV